MDVGLGTAHIKMLRRSELLQAWKQYGSSCSKLHEGVLEQRSTAMAIESHLVETAMLSRVIVGWIVEVISPGSCQ